MGGGINVLELGTVFFLSRDGGFFHLARELHIPCCPNVFGGFSGGQGGHTHLTIMHPMSPCSTTACRTPDFRNAAVGFLAFIWTWWESNIFQGNRECTKKPTLVGRDVRHYWQYMTLKLILLGTAESVWLVVETLLNVVDKNACHVSWNKEILVFL